MKYQKNNLTQTESRRICLFVLNLAIIIGIVIGAVILSVSDNKNIASNVKLNQFFSPTYSGNTVVEVFKNTFFSSELLLIIIMILGFFSLGQPLGIALLVYRGIGIGVSVAQMYFQLGIKSIPSVLILTLPKALALAFIASFGVREMLRLSNAQFKFLYFDYIPDEKMQRTVKLYFIKFLVLTFMIIIVAAFDSALNYLFSKTFAAHM